MLHFIHLYIYICAFTLNYLYYIIYIISVWYIYVYIIYLFIYVIYFVYLISFYSLFYTAYIYTIHFIPYCISMEEIAHIVLLLVKCIEKKLHQWIFVVIM